MTLNIRFMNIETDLMVITVNKYQNHIYLPSEKSIPYWTSQCRFIKPMSTTKLFSPLQIISIYPLSVCSISMLGT